MPIEFGKAGYLLKSDRWLLRIIPVSSPTFFVSELERIDCSFYHIFVLILRNVILNQQTLINNNPKTHLKVNEVDMINNSVVVLRDHNVH